MYSTYILIWFGLFSFLLFLLFQSIYQQPHNTSSYTTFTITLPSPSALATMRGPKCSRTALGIHTRSFALSVHRLSATYICPGAKTSSGRYNPTLPWMVWPCDLLTVMPNANLTGNCVLVQSNGYNPSRDAEAAASLCVVTEVASPSAEEEHYSLSELVNILFSFLREAAQAGHYAPLSRVSPRHLLLNLH